LQKCPFRSDIPQEINSQFSIFNFQFSILARTVRSPMPQLLESTALCWKIPPEYHDRLLGPSGLRLDEWLASGEARIIKHGPHRTVYRVGLSGLSFYIKHNRLPNARAWLRGLVRPSKARMEFDRALAIALRGVPTITPLALGESSGWGPGESGLITLALDGTEALNQFLQTKLCTLEPKRRIRLRQRVACALGGLLARMHDAGVRHNDLHAGNILIRLSADDWPSLYLIDLHAVHLGRPLNWRASRDNLTTLNRWFILLAERSDRLRFWRAYCRARATNGVVRWIHPVMPSARLSLRIPDKAKEIETCTIASNLAFWRSRDRRCVASNRYYRRIRTSKVAGFAITDLDRDVLEQLIDDPDGPFRRQGTALLKDSRSSTVALFDLTCAQSVRRVFYKRFRVGSVADPWKAFLRHSPAVRSWVNGQGLRERCLPTPRPLAVFHRRKKGLAYEGYLLTEEIPRAVDLARSVADLKDLAEGERRSHLRSRIEQLASLVKAMHDRGVSHRDLKAMNILVSNDPVPATNADFGSFHLIDLVGVTLGDSVKPRRREQNLARLHASFHQHSVLTRTDKLRFLRAYLRPGCLGWNRARWKPHWKQWWRSIERATRAKVTRNRRAGRPLA
jgi:tRNA A-37 threonylcarbamoyl transferase component Bud32